MKVGHYLSVATISRDVNGNYVIAADDVVVGGVVVVVVGSGGGGCAGGEGGAGGAGGVGGAGGGGTSVVLRDKSDGPERLIVAQSGG